VPTATKEVDRYAHLSYALRVSRVYLTFLMGGQMPKTNAGFSTPEVARATGLSHRKVAFWAATGLIAPSVLDPTGTGNHRRFSLPDVLAFAALGAMREQGLSLQSLRKVKRFLNDLDGSEFKDVHRLLVYAPGSKRYPNDVALRTNSEIVSLLREPGQRIAPVVVDLGELDRQVRARIERIPQERKERAIEKANQREQRKLARNSTQRRALRVA